MAFAWTEEEDNIIRETYPDNGARATKLKLASKHYMRTEGAVKERAKNLKVRRDMSTMRRQAENKWTDEQLRVLKDAYREGGARLAKTELEKIGCVRTIGAINTRAHMLGIVTPKGERRVDRGGGKKLIRNICLDVNLDKDVIKKLDSVRNRSHYVRELVRRDIKK